MLWRATQVIPTPSQVLSAGSPIIPSKLRRLEIEGEAKSLNAGIMN
jgi:hypothetical protein